MVLHKQIQNKPKPSNFFSKLSLTPSLRNLCELIDKYRNLKQQEFVAMNSNQINAKQILPGYMDIVISRNYIVQKTKETTTQTYAFTVLLFYNIRSLILWIYHQFQGYKTKSTEA